MMNNRFVSLALLEFQAEFLAWYGWADPVVAYTAWWLVTPENTQWIPLM